jgi:hypothetical protein
VHGGGVDTHITGSPFLHVVIAACQRSTQGSLSLDFSIQDRLQVFQSWDLLAGYGGAGMLVVRADMVW